MSVESEFEKMKAHPIEYVCNWMNAELLHVGRPVFNLLALQPCSLIIPDIPFGSNNIRSTFNILYIAPPSTGKSLICKKYSSIMAFNPYFTRVVTPAKLRRDILSSPMFSLIVEDFSEIGEGPDSYEVIKIIEGALGDERTVRKKTMREEIAVETRGVGFLAGTWSDLSRYFEYFKSGLFFRMIFFFIDLTDEQLSEIGRYINMGIGRADLVSSQKEKEGVVKKYYKELEDIQSGNHNTIKPVRSYNVDYSIKDPIHHAWEKKVNLEREIFIKNFKIRLEYSFSRELHEGYRFLISHAFFNIFNRRVDENGVLYINHDDVKYAIEQMLLNLKNKMDVLKSRMYLKLNGSDSVRIIENFNIPQQTKKILLNLANSRIH